MTGKTYKIGDIVRWTDKTGVMRVGVVYETGSLYSRVETFVGMGKLRDLPTAGFQPATHTELFQYIEQKRNEFNLHAILAALDPAAIIEREKKEHPELNEVEGNGAGHEDEDEEDEEK